MLPEAPALGKRLAVRLTPDAFRQVRGGHPWVFDGGIESISHDGAAGDLAVIFDKDRNFRAIGLWDPASPIRIKILHTGKPRTIDDAFFAERVGEAVARRAALVADGRTTAYRLLHGENDALPGLVADVYDRTVVCKIYSAAWWPHLESVLAAIRGAIDVGSVVLRLARNVERELEGSLTDGQVVFGELEAPDDDLPAPPEPTMVRFVENELVFDADVVLGQKTGHFLDQRDNRQRVREASAGADVLDVFSHTGGFSVYAAAGGATSVHSVDRSAPAMGAAVHNMALNPATANCRHTTWVDDAFEVLASLAEDGVKYDVVVIDPPSFASRASEVDGAMRAYRKLTELGLAVTARGGLFVQASCSSRISLDVFVDTVTAGIDAAERGLEALDITQHGIDHPIGFPEGSYLKAVFARLD